MEISPVTQKLVEQLLHEVVIDVETAAKDKLRKSIESRLAALDFDTVVQAAIRHYLDQKLKELPVSNQVIPASAIQSANLRISGDQVTGGLIKNFSSTGIDDRASSCVMTLLDTAVVVENDLVTLDLTVRGNLSVQGHVDPDSEFYQQLIKSTAEKVSGMLDRDLFSGYSDVIFDKLRSNGLDLTRITVNGEQVIDGNKIGYHITDSNLQRLGLLKELQVRGETSIADTFYVGSKRVGVNTIEPTAALSVWDQEIEVTTSKLRENTALFGTPRNQTLVIGSNRNQNITVNPDGSTQIDKLQIGSIKITVSETPPSFVSTRGHIVLNTNPQIGGPMGWICLGNANWANLPAID